MTRRRDFLRSGTLAAVAALSRGKCVAKAGDAAARVVIVGGGFAGGCCALQLRSLNPKLDVTLIDAHAHYVTCPMSDAVVVGLRNLESITTLRSGLSRAGVRLVRDCVTVVDADQRRVRLRGGGVIAYDKLVVAPGIRLLFGRPEGYDEAATRSMPHAWEAGSQTELLAAELQRMSNGGTLAISVPLGLMRCPPGPYERASLIAYWLMQHRKRTKILIFDANNRFPRQEVFSAAWDMLYPGMIEWIPPTEGGAITRIDVRTRTLYSSSGAHRVDVANIIPPQAPGQLAVDAGLATGHGWCPIDPATFASQLASNVHVIGDACIAGAMPKSASAAHSQARHCAATIVAAFEGRATPSPKLDSVCYSMLSPDTALAIHATFSIVEGEIRQVDAVGDAATDRAPSAGRANEASAWYRQIRTECFAG